MTIRYVEIAVWAIYNAVDLIAAFFQLDTLYLQRRTIIGHRTRGHCALTATRAHYYGKGGQIVCGQKIAVCWRCCWIRREAGGEKVRNDECLQQFIGNGREKAAQRKE